ncbi:MAG: T9SS type A sorting domain-containing protein [Bacteroidota bacterium]|nr:T9SS type A sorting domain-containing protein [Bacteroidota bacterium]
MKKSIFVLLSFLSVSDMKAQNPIFSYAYTTSQFVISDFEERDTAGYFLIDSSQPGNLWEIGTPSKVLFDAALSGSLVIITDSVNTYPVGNISSFIFIVKSDDHTEIQFHHSVNSDTLIDGGVVEYSEDGGTTWNNVVGSSFLLNNFPSSSTLASNSGKNGFSGNLEWNISKIKSTAPLNFTQFRFTFTSDSVNTNKEGWMIDRISINCIGVGIQEKISNSGLTVFPNPTNGKIDILVKSGEEILTVNVSDTMGKIVHHSAQAGIDLSSLNKGIYFLEVTTAKGRYYSKIEKQ